MNQADIRRDLCRLSRFGANISDSHSCFIFLPSSILRCDEPRQSRHPEGARPDGTHAEDALEIAGYHSLSNDIATACRISRGAGLVGWVAKHGQSIHVSPFDHDSRTLGYYRTDQKLKSLIGIPVPTPKVAGNHNDYCGVIVCDSKKSFAFSKLQGKLLEDLAQEIANTLRLSLSQVKTSEQNQTWQGFVTGFNALSHALGKTAVEVLRVRIENIHELEQQLGTQAAIELIEQFYRLAQQALPPHFPFFKFPHGDIIVAVDNMMSAFYQNKMRALTQHIAKTSVSLQLQFSRSSFRERRFTDVDSLVQATCASAITMTNSVPTNSVPTNSVPTNSVSRGNSADRRDTYEYGRA